MPFLPSRVEMEESIKWMRKDPLMAATAAIAAAAFSLAQYLEERDVEAESEMSTDGEALSADEVNEEKIKRILNRRIPCEDGVDGAGLVARVPRVVSWSDERGHSLVKVCGEAEDFTGKRVRSNSQSAPALTTVSASTKAPPLKPGSPDHFEGYGDDDGLPLKSPGWGWYVTITPPERHYGTLPPKLEQVPESPEEDADYAKRETNMSE